MPRPDDLIAFPDLDAVIDSYKTGDFLDNRDFHSVVTIQFGELVHDGIVDWNDPMWQWDRYSDEQFARLNAKIERHYWYREIGSLPVKRWNNEFMRKMNEIMPKYKILYDMLAKDPDWLLAYHAWGTHNEDVVETGTEDVDTTRTADKTGTVDQTVDTDTRDDGTYHETVNGTHQENTSKADHNETDETWEEEGTVTTDKDQWGKTRDMESKFPQTLLSGNSDYASEGTDKEHETLEHNVETSAKDGTRNTVSNGTENINVNGTDSKVTDGTTAEIGTSQQVTDRDTTGHEQEVGTKDTAHRDETDLDYQYEDFREGDYLEKYNDIMDKWRDVDLAIINELDSLFSHLLTVNINVM